MQMTRWWEHSLLSDFADSYEPRVEGLPRLKVRWEGNNRWQLDCEDIVSMSLAEVLDKRDMVLHQVTVLTAQFAEMKNLLSTSGNRRNGRLGITYPGIPSGNRRVSEAPLWLPVTFLRSALFGDFCWKLGVCVHKFCMHLCVSVCCSRPSLLPDNLSFVF